MLKVEWTLAILRHLKLPNVAHQRPDTGGAKRRCWTVRCMGLFGGWCYLGHTAFDDPPSSPLTRLDALGEMGRQPPQGAIVANAS